MLDLGKHALAVLHQSPFVAGATDGPAAGVIDMAGFEACLFIGVIGAQDAAATAQLDVEASDLAGDWGSPTIIATAVTPVNSDNTILVIDVKRPKKRFLRTNLTRGGTGNTTWGGTIAILYNPRGTPMPAEATHAVAPVQVVGA